MTPQENIELIRIIIKANKDEVKTATEKGYGDNHYLQYVNDKTEALSDMLKVYEEYWED